MKKTYNRLAVGDRLRDKRTLLGLTQDEMAERIARASKYYADIERGNCGMSIETMLALSGYLNMSLDYMIFGEATEEEKRNQEDEVLAIVEMLENCSERKRQYAMRMLKLFLISCDS